MLTGIAKLYARTFDINMQEYKKYIVLLDGETLSLYPIQRIKRMEE